MSRHLEEKIAKLEQALAESRRDQDFLRQIIRQSPSLIAGFDTDLRFFAASDRYLKAFKTPFPSLEGRHITEVFDQISPETEADLASALQGKEIGPKRVKVTLADGSVEHLIRRMLPFFDEQGIQRGVLSLNESTTERDRAEDELRMSELRYRTLAESTSEAIFISENGIGIDTNRRATEMFGYSYDEIIGMFGTTVVADQDKEMVRDRMLSGYKHPYEMLAQHKDGTTFYTEIRGRNLQYKGKNVRVTIVRDIDNEKKVLQSLKASEQRYRDMVEKLNDVIYTISMQGIVTYVSPVVEGVLGFRPEEIVGRQFFDFVHPHDRAFMLQRFADKKVEAGPPSECRLIHKDSSYRWIRASTSPILVSGQVESMAGVLVDISREKAAEEEQRRLQNLLQQAKRMESLGTLAGGVAHDLNNILSGVVSYPDFLLTEMAKEHPHRRILETIKQSGLRAATLVQDLLSMARRGLPQDTPLDLNLLINDYLNSPEILAILEHHPGVTLSCRLSATAPVIIGSSAHLGKILLNLLTNSAEAMPNGGEAVITTSHLSLDEKVVRSGIISAGDYVCLTVADQGTGIPQESLDRVFEPFFSTKKLGRSGSGLGMAVVWSTVLDHRGHIDIQSSPGEGTVIDLYFPASEIAPLSNNPTVNLEDLYGSGETILLVDDLPEQLRLGEDLLTSLSYRITTASSGEEAVRLVRQQKFDLVILDMIMEPGLDGLATYRRIIDCKPQQKTIIASGFADSTRVREALQLGVISCVRKPFTLAELGMAVRKALS